MSEWISVDDELPDAVVLAFDGKWGEIVFARHSEGKWYIWQQLHGDVGFIESDVILWWMPLPSAPKE